MKKLWHCLTILAVLFGISCSKTGFNNSPAAVLSIGADTIRFDTVFTTTGSVTQSFKIFNRNEQRLNLSRIVLGGGTASPFKINVDGTPGTTFNNIVIEPNDSLYVFVSVAIQPGTSNLPFIVQDSLIVQYNGNRQQIQLEAFGQNANFFRNRRITKDTTWNNTLPFVILSGIAVDSGATLTIEKGCRIFCHADAPFIVNGTLRVNGADTASRVIFKGDRLDPVYAGLPAAWPGIVFSRTSKNNVLRHAEIRNAYQGIVSELPATNNNYKVILNQCIIDNIYDAGILGLASTIRATNCQITNCGSNVAMIAGGNYLFDHCTVATIGNFYIEHKQPVLFITNSDGNSGTYPTYGTFRNCIFYGENGTIENEIVCDKKNSTSPYEVVFEQVLYTNKKPEPNAIFKNAIVNVPPQFAVVETGKRLFDFTLKPASPAIDAAAPIGVSTDLNGKPRPQGQAPDLGCYEH